MYGLGLFKYPNGDIYNGHFIGNMANGYGELSKAERKDFKPDEIKYYIGYWKKNLMHGLGVLMTDDNSKYQGEFKNGVK